jgi:very-short-patch-repair endonuclease
MLHGPKSTQKRAKKLRRSMTLPEVLLWQQLRKHPEGLRFRRQHPAGDYVLDFFCPASRLAIEIDGEAHARSDRPARDRARDTWLVGQSVRVCRIPARDVLRDCDAVVRFIVHCARGGLPLHHATHGPPPPPGEDF